MKHWLHTPLLERLSIEYPLIQAPMGGGISTPQLVAAVANAGGLGMLAAGSLEPEALRQAIAAVRQLTERPFAVNLAIPQLGSADTALCERSHALLAPYRAELGLLPPLSPIPTVPALKEQLAVLIEASVGVVSFTFGLPEPAAMATLKRQGMIIMGTATHLLEAICLEESGVDIVVAQGAEAGGHRATFIGPPERGLVGSMALLPLLLAHLRTPVVAAGGIMNARGIAAALVGGAAGIMLGTAFLACPESGAHPHYKALLAEGTEINTTLSRAFSGRLARCLKNRFTAELQAHDSDWPGFPIQYALTQDIRHAAAEQNRPEFMALWAGQGCPLCTTRPAGALVEEWMQQLRELPLN
ncbi:MAG: nitronate monooxygenase [Candidatus Competibacteraceae bacterium]